MGSLGFSYVGFLYLLLLFIPNMLWINRQPQGYTAASSGEKPLLVALERVGQVGVTCTAPLFTDFNLGPLSWQSLWLLGSFALMLLYQLCWLRYFKSTRTLADFYQSLWGIPLPLATLPPAAFLLLGIYGRVVWMVVSALLLGIGHIGIHLHHAKLAGK